MVDSHRSSPATLSAETDNHGLKGTGGIVPYPVDLDLRRFGDTRGCKTMLLGTETRRSHVVMVDRQVTPCVIRINSHLAGAVAL